MFYHAYEGYIKYAYPLDELRPLTCDGHDTWGSFALTLVDSLDTLAVLGNWSEFRRASQMLLDHLDVNRDENVSVFETNIRVVGGLISAHLLSRRAGFRVDSTWPCTGPLLEQAILFGRKLLPAFDTPTGMPYGTINLSLGGVPPNETSVTCVATIGTCILEFGTLSRLSGDPQFEISAMRALRALWRFRSSKGLLGNHIDVATGRWTASESTIGGSVDSLFEYLVKGAALFRIPELDVMFREYRRSIDLHLRHGDWHLVVNKDNGHVTQAVFQGLDAYWPGVLSLTGDMDAAFRHLTAYHEVWKQYGFIPESYSVYHKTVTSHGKAYHLRPEFIESIYYLYRATKDPTLIRMGNDVLTSIEQIARTLCGYATVIDVTTHMLGNRMESFFLAETTKYLYLLFDDDNFLNALPGDPNTWSSGPSSPAGHECYPDSGGYIFNTEAHPIDPGALDCCPNHVSQPTDRNTEAGTVESPLLLDVEQLEAREEQLNPTEQLLILIDNALSPLTSGNHTKPWMFDSADQLHFELRKTVLDAMALELTTGASFNLTESGFPIEELDFNIYRPTSLTCSYPAFHHRYTSANELADNT